MSMQKIAAGLFCALVVSCLAFADDPPAKKPGQPKGLLSEKDAALLEQERLAGQYQSFEIALLHLAERLQRSKQPEEQERARVLREAIKKSSDLAIDKKFNTLVDLLRTNKAVSINEIKDAMTQSQLLANDIQEILSLLLSSTSDAQKKEEQRRIQKFLKELERIIREEKLARAQTEAGQIDKKTLQQTQKKVTEATQKLAKEMSGEPKESKDGKSGKSGEKNQGQPKPSQQGDKKEGDQKKGEEGKKGDQQAKNSEKAPEQDTPGRKQVQDAVGDQKKAEEKIDKEKKDEASNHQDEAIKKLEDARKKLEEILRQLREEEQQRLLAALQQRCQMMLAMQIEVQEGTQRLEKAIGQNADQRPGRPEEQRSLQLSDREREIVRQARKALELLETEGSAVAFPEVFSQVRDDAETVARRLSKVDVGTVTQGIEQDIIDTLKEMIEALKKAQQAKNGQQQKPGENSKSQNQNLIDLIAELKMIRSLQIRVNQRTLVYGRQYQGEQANDSDIQHELGNLAERQLKIFDVTNNLARGKNR